MTSLQKRALKTADNFLMDAVINVINAKVEKDAMKLHHLHEKIIASISEAQGWLKDISTDKSSG